MYDSPEEDVENLRVLLHITTDSMKNCSLDSLYLTWRQLLTEFYVKSNNNVAESMDEKANH